MIVCPNCLHKEMVGAIFCAECGARLVNEEGIRTDNISVPSTKPHDAQPVIPVYAQETAISPSDTLISLSIISSGEVIPLSGQKEITIGRYSEGQPIIPDIDLAQYKAFESGVSRMHASLRVVDDQVMAIDLGSANGTRINGMKIEPHTPYPLRHGDILTLGKFKIQVLLRKRSDGG
jgi:pSer/pThr/pTyr-binding forkhead associated (FHA) protein